MKEWIGNLIRPHEDEPFQHTAKRILGGGVVMLASAHIIYKDGYTVPNALRASDLVGTYLRHFQSELIKKAETYIGSQEQYLGQVALEAAKNHRD